MTEKLPMDYIREIHAKSEDQIKNLVVPWFEARGGFVVRTNSGRAPNNTACQGWYGPPHYIRETSGGPDFTGHLYGVYVAIECKAPGEVETETSTRKKQRKCETSLQLSGGIYVIVDSRESLDEIEVLVSRKIGELMEMVR